MLQWLKHSPTIGNYEIAQSRAENIWYLLSRIYQPVLSWFSSPNPLHFQSVSTLFIDDDQVACHEPGFLSHQPFPTFYGKLMLGCCVFVNYGLVAAASLDSTQDSSLDRLKSESLMVGFGFSLLFWGSVSPKDGV